MMVKKLLFLFLFSVSSIITLGQITNFKEKFELPEKVEETSGLLFLDGKIITHNDSGDNANLYEIDSLSGNLLRTISINNATNIDWEDITDDENHIYIGDMGNNDGDRTDLKIYKILKTDFKNNTSVSAEIISFSYEDQTNFSSSNDSNFDSEAIVVLDSSILIFTKNRGDFKTNVYKIPTTAGSYTAVKISTANINGLITGATIQDNNFLLCGYDSDKNPFLIFISFNRAPGDDIFNNGFYKYPLDKELPNGSQVEGITSFDFNKFYISREKRDSLEQKLFEFTDYRFNLLSTNKNILIDFNMTPNPAVETFSISSKRSIHKIVIYNPLGEKILVQKTNQNEINISHLSKGIYLVKVDFEDNSSFVKKLIKL